MTPEQFKDTAAYKEASALFNGGDKKAAAAILARYDVLKHSTRTHRAAKTIDRSRPDITGYDRLYGISAARKLEANTACARSIVKQFRLNVAGSIKAQFNTDDEVFNEEASFWFNSCYAKTCDFIGDSSLVEIAQNLVAAAVREGDALIVFDDFIEGSGKLKIYEADQLVTVSAKSWEENRPSWCNDSVPMGRQAWTGRKRYENKAFEQNAGIITDRFGKVRGYIVTNDRGAIAANVEDVTILPEESCKLFKVTERANQYRGVASLLSTAAEFEDIYEMRGKELQAAKVSSSFAGVVTSDHSEVMQDMFNTAATVDDLLGDTATGASSRETYAALESLTGGNIAYLAKDDDFKELNLNRPNMETEAFYNSVSQSAGSSMGMAKAYTKLSADSSYTSFRGDMLMTWVTFEDMQKLLERKFLDWLVYKACVWAIDEGLISAPVDPLWNYKISWKLPVMKQIDPIKEATANALNFKNGFIDLTDIHGPDWRGKIDKIAEQVQYIREKNLPLEILETKAGALVPNANDSDNDTE